MTTKIQSPKERYGLNIRPLPLATQEAFRRQAAARGMTQATYFQALMSFSERVRVVYEVDPGTTTGDDMLNDILDEFDRLGLKRVVT